MFELALYFSSDIPRIGIAGCMVAYFQFFEEPSCSFHGAVPICFLTNSIRGFPFSHIFASTCCLWSFYDIHSDKHGVLSLCGF